jgi:hypothetical protein
MPEPKQSTNEYRVVNTDDDRSSRHRVTATELIDGVQHLLILEQDATGCYREVTLEPLTARDRMLVPQAVL